MISRFSTVCSSSGARRKNAGKEMKLINVAAVGVDVAHCRRSNLPTLLQIMRYLLSESAILQQQVSLPSRRSLEYALD